MKLAATLAISALALTHGAHAIAWSVFSEQGCTGFLWGTSELLNVTATACVQQGSDVQSVRFAAFDDDNVSCKVSVFTDNACSEFEGNVEETSCLVFGETGQSYKVTCA